jgi:hypothetical protein
LKLAGWVLCAALAAVLLTPTQRASAFCRTLGCNDDKQDCKPDENGCLTEGEVLHCGSECLSFDVQRDGSALREIDYAAARDAVHQAFRTWLNADCGNGQGPRIRIEDWGPVACRTAEYNQKAGNANIVMFRDDDWPYDNAIDILALTTLIFNAETGEIYDADIEVNSIQQPMSIGAVGQLDIDFNSVITHEVGHFLGLSHSNEPGSTMRPSYVPGNTEMASLEQDDIDGICTVLSPTRELQRNSCEPRHGFSAECALETNGCQLGAGHASTLGGWLGALVVASSMLGWRLRRAGQRRATSPGPRRGPGSAS